MTGRRILATLAALVLIVAGLGVVAAADRSDPSGLPIQLVQSDDQGEDLGDQGEDEQDGVLDDDQGEDEENLEQGEDENGAMVLNDDQGEDEQDGVLDDDQGEDEEN